MATARLPGLFAPKPVDEGALESDGGLRRAVGALDLTALGVGAVIGTGIFVVIGQAIGDSGPAIVLSFVLAGLTCMFSALSYAELASTMPVSGSAYAYVYATMGELPAWIIGWDLIIEYGISVAAVAVGWGAYLQDLLASLTGLELPDAIAGPPGDGGTVNLPAALLVAGIAALLVVGVRESARANTVMVVLKIAVLLFFVAVGLAAFQADHFDDFAPNGFAGIANAGALIFFAYIGFDAISTAGGEARRPGRDLPIAILGALAIATLLYVGVALAAVGLAPADELAGSDAPLTDAIRAAGVGAWAGDLLSAGALVAISSVVLTILFGQTRIVFAMARDGLMPGWFGRLSGRQTPARITIVFATVIALLAALIPLSELAELVNIGTLFAFVLVNVGVVWLRHARPDLPRRFRVPLVPIVPGISAALCIYLMTKLSAETWWRFGLWLALGLAIYALYGRRHSRVRHPD